jgi:hypothetical protein
MANIIKEHTHDFVTGEISYNEFYKFLLDNYNEICLYFQNEINKIQASELDSFFDRFSQPIIGEINFYNENSNKSIEELKKCMLNMGKRYLKHY